MMLTLDRSKLRYFESPWSIFERIKTVNFVNSKDLISVYGFERSSSLGKLSKRIRDLWKLEQFDHKKLNNSLGFSLIEHVAYYVWELTKMLPLEIRKNNMFRDTLFYCPECIKYNDHSLLHQFKWINRCPFHLCELHSSCTNCGVTIPYLLPQYNHETGICDCVNLLGECVQKRSRG
jgi:hypothetical protein